MSAKPTVTLLGANGVLGVHVLNALLSSTFKSSYSLPIRVVTRDLAKIKSALGPQVADADVKGYSADVVTGEGLGVAFEGADVVVNLLGIEFSHNKVVDAAAAAGSVKLYLPSEFSTFNDNLGPFRDLLKIKDDALEYAVSKGLNTVAVVTGTFLELFLTFPFGGVNSPERGQFSYYGDIDTKVTSTAFADVGNTVASLGLKDPSTIPRHVLVGDTFSLRDLKSAYEKANNTTLTEVPKPKSEIVDRALAIVGAGAKNLPEFVEVIQAVMATGRAEYEPKGNEFVSAGLFQFKTLDVVAAETAQKLKQ